VLHQARGRRVVLEVKKPPGGRATEELTALAVGELLKPMQSAGLDADVTVSSFSPEIVRAVRTLLPPGGGVRTALLGLPRDGATALLRRALEDGHDEIHPHVSRVTTDEGVVATAHACGMAVVPWTVNRRRDVRRLAMLGVDGLITDVPVTARAAVSPTPV
jgi:glycerophosphoryl diester phosphodiesterase